MWVLDLADSDLIDVVAVVVVEEDVEEVASNRL
jgi:hypothetical protein